MPVKLEIYLDHHKQASGILYLDDGDSFRYRSNNEKTLLRYTFADNILSYKVELPDCYFEHAYDIKLTDVSIYGMDV